MSIDARRPDESQEQYKQRRRVQNYVTKAKLSRGRVLWDSSDLGTLDLKKFRQKGQAV